MKTAKKLICLVLCAAIALSMVGWTSGDIWSPEEYPIIWDCANPKCMQKGNTGEVCTGQDRTTKEPCGQVRENAAKTYPFDAAKNKILEDCVVAENDTYQLRWIPELNGTKVAFVELIEKATGNRWGVTDTMNGELTTIEQDGKEIVAIVDESGEMVSLPKPEVASTLVVKVLDTDNNQPSPYFSFVSAVKNNYITTEKIENGIRICYYMNDVQIMIPVEFVLREDSVAVTVDPSKMLEGSRFKAVNVQINSFWCSNQNDNPDDYLFYPSGSGALVSNSSVSSAGTVVENPVYGFDPAMVRNNLVTTDKEIRVPVFGAKRGDTAICGIIEKTPESANIGVKVGSTSLANSAVYATYQVRGYSVNKSQALNNYKVDVDVYSLSPCDKPMTIGFYPLTGENANYTGMANVYKNFLKDSGRLGELTDDSPLNVSFVGGVMVNKSFFGIPYTDLVAATTLSEAETILGEIKSDTGAKISAKLIGFGTTGVELGGYAGGMKINKNLGKLKDLDSLSAYCGENGVDLYFDFDIMKLKDSSAGFSGTFDTAYNSVLKTATAYRYNVATRAQIANSKYMLLSRPLLFEGIEKVMKKTAKWNLAGISLGDLGCAAYSDYSTETTDYYVKGGMPQDVAELIAVANEKYKVATNDANDYAALASDIVFNAPMISAQQNIFTEDVPFYQMVFKGYVALTGETANNAVNPNTHKLMTVESGVGLSYTVINKYYNEFIDYRGYYFYGSEFAGIRDDIKETYGELKDYYAAINGAEIVAHNILESGLRETVFSNGVKAYVNYTDAELTAPSGATVAADSYIWEGGK